MVYLIHYEGYFKNVRVKTFETVEYAKWTLEALKGPESTGLVIEQASDLREIRAGKSLLDLYNALASEDDPVIDKFASKADGQLKLFHRLEDKFRDQSFEPTPSEAAVPNEEPAQEQSDMVTKASKRKKTAKVKAKAPKAAKAKTARKTKVKVASNGAARNGSITETIDKMVRRDRGATKKELVAEIMKKSPERDPTATDNTVRGTLSVMGRNKSLKLKKTKDEKRDGLVYSI